MEGRFKLTQVCTARLGMVRMPWGRLAGALCLAPLLAAMPGAGLSLAQSGASNGSVNGAPPAAINPAPPAVRRPDLELGRQGGAVAELQGVLKLLGFYGGETNGLYDEATSLAVVRFQAAARLPQTGRVSTKTWNALFPLDAPRPAIATATPAPQPAAPGAPAPGASNPAPAAAQPAAPRAAATPKPAIPKPAASEPAAAQPAAKPNPYPTLKVGEEGEAVMRLQRRLQQKGFLSAQPDGAFGPMTEEAVKEAQDALGLEVDGVVGPATWRALLN